jgi:hypothetical protein
MKIGEDIEYHSDIRCSDVDLFPEQTAQLSSESWQLYHNVIYGDYEKTATRGAGPQHVKGRS